MNIQFLSNAQIETEIGARIRKRRVVIGLNQSELAAKAGLGRRTISAVENGQGATMGTFIAILRALGALGDLGSLLADPGFSPIAVTSGTSAKARERKYPYKPRGKKDKAAWHWGDEKA